MSRKDKAYNQVLRHTAKFHAKDSGRARRQFSEPSPQPTPRSRGKRERSQRDREEQQQDQNDQKETAAMSDSVFAKFDNDAWPYWYAGELKVGILAGGVPQDPNVVESWIKTKLRDIRSDAEIQDIIATTMAELGVSEEEAVKEASSKMVGMNGFKRDETGLYVEGRQLKAALKEAVMVAANSGKLETGKWGKPDNASYKKQIKGWFPEHVFVVEERLYILHDGKPVQIHDGVTQKFVHTHRGDSISYEQFVKDAQIRFTIKSDYEMTEKQWGMIWLTGQMQGFGASRSQEYGRYVVTGWEPTTPREGGFHPEAAED